MNKFCIAILSYNHPEITARAVESALRFCEQIKTQPPPAVLLIHNGSQIKNIELLKKNFPTLIHAHNLQNQGYSGGVNFGLRHAFSLGFEWIFLLTNDCTILHLEIPKSDQKPAMIAPLIYRRKIDKIDSCGGSFCPSKASLVHLKSEDEFHALLTPQHKQHISYPYIPGSAFWLHKNLTEKIGWMDESLGTYWEDVDFSVRAHLHSQSLEINTRNMLIHQVGKTNHKDPHYTTYLFQRNRRLISKKYIGKSKLKKILLYLRLNFELFKIFIILLLKNNRSKMKMIWQVFLES